MSNPAVPQILMCPPDYFSIDYEINPWMNVADGSDSSLAKEQWTALCNTLIELGVVVDLLEPVQGLPDLVFTANAALIFRNIFILSKFRYGVRQGESLYFENWARRRGFKILELPDSHNFEGAGDALFCGETLVAGYRFRSDVRSHQWIGEKLEVEVLPLELVDPRFYHLDTCFCPLAADQALYYPGAFDEYGRTVLRDRIPHLIEVAAEEAASFSCNAVVVGNHVILNQGTPKLTSELIREGYTVHPLSFSEFIKSGGSAKCLTFRIDGEEAAAWKYDLK
jgi:N-dimethylarginine dimethylaminohydrolase